MNDLFDQIRAAMSQQLYYVALFTALAIPDICGAMGSVNGVATSALYKAWFDTYVAPKYEPHRFISGEEFYRFRCSLLHQGRTMHPMSAYQRIVFGEPGSAYVNHTASMSSGDDAILLINLQVFIERVV